LGNQARAPEENWLTGRLEDWRRCVGMLGGLREGMGKKNN
jgi:hypothetical protein